MAHTRIAASLVIEACERMRNMLLEEKRLKMNEVANELCRRHCVLINPIRRFFTGQNKNFVNLSYEEWNKEATLRNFLSESGDRQVSAALHFHKDKLHDVGNIFIVANRSTNFLFLNTSEILLLKDYL